MENVVIDQPAANPPNLAPRHPRTEVDSRPRSAWKVNVRWLAMICLLLGVSGSFRYLRDFQFATLQNQGKDSPFPLKTIPTLLGSWRMIEGAETTLDPQIARIAGSSDHIVRTYENTKTGDQATVLVLYGLADLVWGHTPEVCYPAAGYTALAESHDVQVSNAHESKTSTMFRAGTYGLTQGGASSYQEVFYTFLNGGIWSPEMQSRWKQFRHHPGMFKIQVERRLTNAGKQDEACFDLLAALVDVINTESSNATAPNVVAASH